MHTFIRTVIRTLPHKHRVFECFSLGLAFLKRLHSNVCHVLLCVFSLTNIGFVQCLSLGPVLSLYAFLCYVMLCYVMRTFRASCVDRSLHQPTEVSDVYRHWPLTNFFGSEFLAMRSVLKSLYAYMYTYA